MPASQMLNSLPGIDPARRDRLVEVLDIDPTWRMHLVSGVRVWEGGWVGGGGGWVEGQGRECVERCISWRVFTPELRCPQMASGGACRSPWAC